MRYNRAKATGSLAERMVRVTNSRERLAAVISRGAEPVRTRKATIRKGQIPNAVLLIKSHQVARLLGMTSTEVTAALRTVSTTDLLGLVESLASELRRLNQLAADTAGDDQLQSLTAGESGLEGLAKYDAATLQRALGQHQSAVGSILEAALTVHDERKREATLAKRNSLPESRNVPRTLDQLEAWANARVDVAESLSYQPDTDGGAAALGISKACQDAAHQIQKSRSQSLPADSFRSSTEPVVTAQGQGGKVPVDQLPWYARSRR